MRPANTTVFSFHADYGARELKSSTPELVSNDISVKDSWRSDLLGKNHRIPSRDIVRTDEITPRRGLELCQTEVL